MVTVSVCIPTILTPDRNKDLERLLRSLTIQSFQDFEVILIKGKNYEEVKKVPTKFKIKVLKQKSNGLSNARNEAWVNSSCEICVFIDDDVVATPLWLEEIVKTYRTYGDIGGVGGPSLTPKGLLSSRDITNYLLNPDSLLKRIVRSLYFNFFLEDRPFEIKKFFRSGAYSLGSMVGEIISKISHPIEVDFLVPCNMSFKRRVLEDVGGFDNAYTGLGDYHEPDLCFRVRNIGYKLVFNPKATVYHFPKKIGSGAESSRAFERQRNFARFVKRNIGFSFDFLLYALFLCGYHLYKSISEKDSKWTSGIFGLIEGLFEE